MGEAGAPSAPPFPAGFICFLLDNLKYLSNGKALCSGGVSPAPPLCKRQTQATACHNINQTFTSPQQLQINVF